MLPGCSSGVDKGVIVSRIEVGRERTADLAQNLEWRDGSSPRVGVLQQRAECFAHMGVGDGTPQRTPQPLDAVGLRIIRRRINQHELPTLLLEEVSQHERAFRRMDAQVVEQDHGDPSTSLGTLDRTAQLGTERDGSPTSRPRPVEPAVAPIDQSEAVLFPVIAGRLDQALPTPTFGAPDAGQGGMQGHLDFILQIDVRPRQ